MSNRILLGLLITISIILLTSCQSTSGKTPETSAIGLPNPASVYCQGLGYREETREEPEGQYGVCIFPEGEECDTWDFLAGRCGQEYSYCVKQGYELIEVPDSNIGACLFPDGTQCPEYEFFQGNCGPK